MLSRLTGFVCPTVSMVTNGHATGVEKTLLTLRAGNSIVILLGKNSPFLIVIITGQIKCIA